MNAVRKRVSFRRILPITLVVAGVFLIGLFRIPSAKGSAEAAFGRAGNQPASPTPLPLGSGAIALDTTIAPTPTFDVSRMVKPIVASVPSQVEQGHLIYWGVCMACHGDRGQGMTDEWRESYGEDRNCWQSKCHGMNHPTPGFRIPEDLYFPALANPGSLARFLTAQDMHDFIVAKMPWWKPGSTTSDKAWQVTAYILKMKGVLPAGLILSAANAADVPVRQLAPAPDDHLAEAIFAAALILAALGLSLQAIRSQRVGATLAVARSPSPIPATSAEATSSRHRPSLRHEAQGRGARKARASFFAHLHPPTIPADQARWRYTLGLGGLGVFLSVVLVITGLLEMFYYLPSPEQAAYSIQTITFLVPYGGFVRNLHYWAAQALVVVALVHLLRVVFTGASSARRFNYLLGIGLLLTILFFDFTGYVLRWDEGIRWALVAGTNLIKSIPAIGESLFFFVVGGSNLGAAALIRFYTWHVYALGIVGAIFLVWHLFRVRRDGGIAAPPNGVPPHPARIDRFELLKREVLAMLIAGFALVLLSAFLRAPIALPIRDNVIQMTEARAPWFFLWVQQLLRLGNPFLLGVLVPLSVLLTLAIVPYIFPRPADRDRGRWFPPRARAASILVALIFLAILVLTILGYLNANT